MRKRDLFVKSWFALKKSFKAVALFLGLAVGILTLYIAKNISKSDSSKTSNQDFLIILAAIAAPVAIISIVRFLKSDVDYGGSGYRNYEKILDKQRKLISELEKRQNRDSNVRTMIADYIDQNLTISEVQKTVYDLTLKNLETELLRKLAKDYEVKKDFDTVKIAIDDVSESLEQNVRLYLLRLKNNSIINLIIGITATSISISVLSFALLTKREFDTIETYLIFFLPRVVFVVSIQLFAFFFLRLYKNNLDDAKYFQNELTNITSKTAAMKIAYLLQITDRISDCITRLTNVERNFNIGKGETLHAIESSKIDRDYDMAYLKYQDFLQVLKQVEKK